jgi:CBS domain-containing protein
VVILWWAATPVPADTPLKQVAELLVERRISGVPVVDERCRVLGVLSEADIVVREHAGLPRGELLAWLSEAEGATLEAKLGARTAGEAMTRPATTIPAGAPLVQAAATMVQRGVNRLPVVDEDGVLVGIVARSDLVRAFARSDAELERELREGVLPGGFLWCSPGRVDVQVADGEVTLVGEVESEDVAQLLARLVERVPGVVSVRSELRWPAPSA